MDLSIAWIVVVEWVCEPFYVCGICRRQWPNQIFLPKQVGGICSSSDYSRSCIANRSGRFVVEVCNHICLVGILKRDLDPSLGQDTRYATDD